jgi:ubiquinone/menaquinone biosynthesis C-methylase UbiE
LFFVADVTVGPFRELPRNSQRIVPPNRNHRRDSKTMRDVQRTYLPAAGRDWALPLYDPFVKLLGADAARKALLDQAAVRNAHRVLDIGCGTGTLATLIKRLHPDVDVVGLDPDPKALARARRKAERAAVSIQFDRGFSHELPYPEASFNLVFSTFMFHHLEADEREKTLREARRVLAPGGSLHMLDFQGPDAHADGSFSRLFHASHRLSGNSGDEILAIVREAGFTSSKRVMDGAILFGRLRIGYYQASAPAQGRSVGTFQTSGPSAEGGG